MDDFNNALLAACLLGYGLGSIPFGLLITKIAGVGDIRQIGSGNIGATNVLRTGKKSLALLTLLLDGGKGAAAVLLAQHFLAGFEPIAALFALLGHVFPVWLKFRGGKGVATMLGILLAAAWPVGLIALAAWVFVAALFHYSSLGALVALGTAPLFVHLLGYDTMLWVAVLMTMLVIWKHAANIGRLVKGTEPKIGKKRHDATPSA